MSAYSDSKGGDDGKKQVLITAAKAELEKLKALKTWLGFSLYRREGDTVMRVKGVLPASPAISAGLADDMALYKAKGVTIGAIADFAGQVKGTQVGDKIDLEVELNGSNQHVTLIVGTQAAPVPFVNTIVRIAVDNEVQESDYEIPELKPAVDEWVSKNAASLEESRKKEEEGAARKKEEQKKAAEEEQRKKDEEAKKAEEEEKTKTAAAITATATTPTAAASVTSPTAAAPGKKPGCKFGFRPHTDKWKKDTCLMCGKSKAAHEEGYVAPEPSPRPTTQAPNKDAEEKARKEKEEQEAREKEEAEKKQREEEERNKKEIEEQEAKVREELEKIAKDEAELKEAEAKLAADEEDRKKQEEEKKKEDEKSAAASATAASSTTSPKPAAAPSRGKKCPFGYRPDPNPRKKGFCAICGRSEADHAADASGAASPPPTTAGSASSATSPPAAAGGGAPKAWSPFLQKQFEEKQKKEAERLKREEADRLKKEEEERKQREEEEKKQKEEEERRQKEEEERRQKEEEERLKREEEERKQKEEEERAKREEEERLKKEEEDKKKAEEEAKKKSVEDEEKRKAAWATASPAKSGVAPSRTRPKCPFGFKPDSNPRKKGICAICGLTEPEHVKK